MPIGFFFDGVDEDGTNPLPAGCDDDLLCRETLELVRRYYGLPPPLRRDVYELVKDIAGVWGKAEARNAGASG